ncbi:MAG TPA: hypothetical protein VNU70_10875 [Puia sp.]|jgi:hypothetical protein|nr:hypothetical protein [Puia sp.]
MKNQDREELKQIYAKLVGSFPEATLKGATIPYTSIQGNMYSYLSKDGFVALRLPEASRIAFLEKYNTTLVMAYGVLQKEYVVVPNDLLRKTALLKKHFQASLDYAKSLKPKPTKRAKK